MKFCKTFALIGLAGLLSSCQTTVFGVDQEVWKTLNEEQRTEAIRSYNKIKEMEAQERIEKERQKRKHAEYRSAEAEKNAKVIRVILNGGEITKHNEVHKLRYKENIITHGTSSRLNFEPYDGQKNSLKSCKISYKEGLLKIGEDDGILDEAIEIEYNDSWRDGVSYKNLEFPSLADYDGWISLYITTKKSPSYERSIKLGNDTSIKFKIGK
jgi:hypothetical protein